MESADCIERIGANNTDAYYRDNYPGAMMMPIFECDIGDAQCCGPLMPIPPTGDITCNQGNVASYAVNVSSAEDV